MAFEVVNLDLFFDKVVPPFALISEDSANPSLMVLCVPGTNDDTVRTGRRIYGTFNSPLQQYSYLPIP